MEHTFETFHLEPQTTIALRWEKWINRFDIFLVARNINNAERKKAMLLHSAGEEVYDVYDSLQIPAESTYDEFKTLLSEYFAPKRNINMSDMLSGRKHSQLHKLLTVIIPS